MGRVNGLAQIVDSAELEGLDRVGNLTLTRNHNSRQMDSEFADITQQLEAVFARHPEIRDKDVRIEAADQLQCLNAVVRYFAAKAPRGEGFAPLLMSVGVVLGD